MGGGESGAGVDIVFIVVQGQVRSGQGRLVKKKEERWGGEIEC